MIDAARPMVATERLTVVPCPGVHPRTGHACRHTLVEAWTSSEMVERRRCKQCGGWFRVRLRADGTFVVSEVD